MVGNTDTEDTVDIRELNVEIKEETERQHTCSESIPYFSRPYR